MKISTYSSLTPFLKSDGRNVSRKKIGSVQAWKNATVEGIDWDAMWIELDKDPGCPTCRWAQFVTRNDYDSQGKPASFWYSIFLNQYIRHMGTRYLDTLAFTDHWWMSEANTGDNNTVAYYDQPSAYLNDQWVKDVDSFNTFLICQAQETDCNGNPTTGWKPAFQITWSATHTAKDSQALYEVSSAGSIKDLPGWANGPLWIWANDDNNNQPGKALGIQNPTR